MATGSNHPADLFTLRPEEVAILEKRRKAVREYDPPKWRSSYADPVSGQCAETPMVDHASILLVTPVCGLCASLCLATGTARGPDIYYQVKASNVKI